MSLKFFLLFLMLVSFVGLNAQLSTRSQLYSSNGELIVYPKYSIDSTRVNDVALFEYYTLSAVYSNVKYPFLGLENGISGMVIAKIRIDTIGVNLDFIGSEIEYFFYESVKNGINASKRGMLGFIKVHEIKLPFEFYIPFQFVYEDPYREGLKNKNTVVIKERPPTGGISILK